MKITKTKPCQECYNAGEQISLVLDGEAWHCEAGHEMPVTGTETMRAFGAAPLFDDDPRDPDVEYDLATEKGVRYE